MTIAPDQPHVLIVDDEETVVLLARHRTASL